MVKYTPQFLKKLEEVFEENGYQVRYEKGNFKSGYCIIEDRKMVVINKFAAIESRINTLVEITRMLGNAGAISGEKTTQLLKTLSKEQNLEETAG
jgi:hypothetical protein